MSSMKNTMIKQQKRTLCWRDCAILGLLVVMTSCGDGRCYLTTLHASNGYQYEIYTDSFYEITAPLDCQVTKKRTVIFPFVTIGYTIEDPYDPDNFEFMLLEYDDLVAIIEKSAPDVVLAIYDIQQHLAWPCADITMTWQEETKRGEELLQRLQKYVPDSPLILRVKVGGGRRDVKVR